MNEKTIFVESLGTLISFILICLLLFVSGMYFCGVDCNFITFFPSGIVYICKIFSISYTVFPFFQGVLVFLAAKSRLMKDAQEAAAYQNFIICIEMLLAAVCHLYAFSYKEYAGANIGGSCGLTGSLAHALKLNDFYHDTVHQVI